MKRLKSFSRAVFGNSHKLEVLAVIAGFDRPFYAREIAAELGIADNLVTTQLRSLVSVGLLEPVEGGRVNYYSRCPSPLWEAAPALVMSASGIEDASPSASASQPALDSVALESVAWALDILEQAGELKQQGEGMRFSTRSMKLYLQSLLSFAAELSADELSTTSLMRLAEGTGIRRQAVVALLELPLDLLVMGVFEAGVRSGALRPATRLRLDLSVERASSRRGFGIHVVSGTPLVVALVLSAETPDGIYALAQIPVALSGAETFQTSPADVTETPPGEPRPADLADSAIHLLNRLSRFYAATLIGGQVLRGFSRDLPVAATVQAPDATWITNMDRAALLARLTDAGHRAVVAFEAEAEDGPNGPGDHPLFVPPEGDPFPIGQLVDRLAKDSIDGFEWAPTRRADERAILLETGPGGLALQDRLLRVVVVLDLLSAARIAVTNIDLESPAGRTEATETAAALDSVPPPHPAPIIQSRASRFSIRQGTRHLGLLLSLTSRLTPEPTGPPRDAVSSASAR